MNIKAGKEAIAEASRKLSNWGRWGKDDQIGTLNHVRPEDIVRAASLIKRGKVFALGIPLDANGPQTGLFGGRLATAAPWRRRSARFYAMLSRTTRAGVVASEPNLPSCSAA